MKLLLMIMAAVEAGAGLALFIVPAFTVSMLLGVPLDTPGGVVVARLGGAGLTALAIACWNARNGERGGAASGVVTAMLFYNAAAVAVIVYAIARLGFQSPFLWPVIVLHTVLAAWCLLNIRVTERSLAKAAGNEDGNSES